MVTHDWRDDIEINMGSSTVELMGYLCYLGTLGRNVTSNSNCDKGYC